MYQGMPSAEKLVGPFVFWFYLDPQLSVKVLTLPSCKAWEYSPWADW